MFQPIPRDAAVGFTKALPLPTHPVEFTEVLPLPTHPVQPKGCCCGVYKGTTSPHTACGVYKGTTSPHTPWPRGKAAPWPRVKAAPWPRGKAAPWPRVKAAPWPRGKAAPWPRGKAAAWPRGKAAALTATDLGSSPTPDVDLFPGPVIPVILSTKTECDYLNSWIKNRPMCKNLTKNGEPQRYSWRTQRRRHLSFKNWYSSGYPARCLAS